MKNKQNRWAITDRMFLSLFLTGAVIEFSQVGAGFIDGLVISRFLGAEEMAAEGIVYPIYSILGVISGLLSIGMQVSCARLIGRGNRKDFSRFFSVTVYAGAAVSLLLMLLILIFTEPLAALLGASGNAAGLLSHAAGYLKGVGIGVPPLIMSAIFAPALQLDSGGRIVRTGALINAVSDVVLDIIAVKAGLGIFGIGLATAAASYLNLLYQCRHFLKKDRMLRFVRPDLTMREFLSILGSGGETAVKRLMNTVRPVILNAIIISNGGAVAMAALSVRNNCANFTEIIGAGLASAVGLLCGLYYGEINEEAISEVDSYSKKLILILNGSVSVLLLIFAPQVARIFITGEGELFGMVTFAIRLLALQGPLQALISCRIKYLQSIRLTVNMNLLIVASKLVFVLFSAFVLGSLFGVYGILACFTVSDALSLLAVCVFYLAKTRKRLPKQVDFLNLPAECHLSPGDVISLDIRGIEDVTLGSEQIMYFCRGHKIDRRTAYFAALCFEELGRNTVEYGFPENNSDHPIIDLRAVVTDSCFVIRLRDNCPKFDITERIAAVEADTSDPTRNIGIRIVSGFASDITYLQTFETNTVILRFSERPESARP